MIIPTLMSLLEMNFLRPDVSKVSNAMVLLMFLHHCKFLISPFFFLFELWKFQKRSTRSKCLNCRVIRSETTMHFCLFSISDFLHRVTQFTKTILSLVVYLSIICSIKNNQNFKDLDIVCSRWKINRLPFKTKNSRY